jgi:hypothetical protein
MKQRRRPTEVAQISTRRPCEHPWGGAKVGVMGLIGVIVTPLRGDELLCFDILNVLKV